MLLWWEDLYLEVKNSLLVQKKPLYFQLSPDKNEKDEAESNISNIAEEMVEVSKCRDLEWNRKRKFL